MGRAEAAVSLLHLGGTTAGDLVAGTANADYDLVFTTNVTAVASQFIVTYPAGFTIGGSAAVQSLTGVAGNATVNGLNQPVVVSTNPAAGQVIVTLTAPASLASMVQGFRITSGVTNPASSGTYSVAVTTNASGEIGANGNVTVTTGTSTPAPGTLTNTSVVPQTKTPGATGNVAVSFKTTSALPTNGHILITFPSGFTLNSGGATQVASDNITESVIASASGQTVTVFLLGGGSGKAAGSEVNLTLTNVRNPSATGKTGTFALATRTSTGAAIDSGTAAGVQIGTPAVGDRDGHGKPWQAHKVTICHKGKTQSVARVAWQAHFHRVATMGACR